MTSEEKNNLFWSFQTLLAFIILVAGISFIFSVFQVPKYKGQIRLLVVQDFEKNIDPYSATKSNEYVTNILSEVIYSSSFLDEVLASGFRIQDSFDKGSFKRLEDWKKMVHAYASTSTGILEVSVINSDREQTRQIVSAISFVLLTKGNEYYGNGNIKLKLIDPPAVSQTSVYPNVPLNILVGSILGLMSGIGFMFLFPQYRLNFLENKNWNIFSMLKKTKVPASEKIVSSKSDIKRQGPLFSIGKIVKKGNPPSQEPEVTVPQPSTIKSKDLAPANLPIAEDDEIFISSQKTNERDLPSLRDHMNISY